jgi:DNA-binding MarR family transcriptional regulator
MLDNIILFLLSSSFITISLIIILYYLPIIKKNTKQQEEASQLIKDIILDIQNRLKNQDEKLLDQKIKLDLIEIKLQKNDKNKENNDKNRIILDQDYIDLKNIKELKNFYQRKEINLPNIIPEIVSDKKQNKISSMLNPTEIFVLKLINQGLKTPKEIQIKINKSREHVSRMMKNLCDMNYVTRDKNKKPYKYELTNNSKRFL